MASQHQRKYDTFDKFIMYFFGAMLTAMIGFISWNFQKLIKDVDEIKSTQYEIKSHLHHSDIVIQQNRKDIRKYFNRD